jgi:hypothetical protein
MREHAGSISPPIGMLVWRALNRVIESLRRHEPASAALSPTDTAPSWESWVAQQHRSRKRWRAAQR